MTYTEQIQTVKVRAVEILTERYGAREEHRAVFHRRHNPRISQALANVGLEAVLAMLEEREGWRMLDYFYEAWTDTHVRAQEAEWSELKAELAREAASDRAQYGEGLVEMSALTEEG